MLTVKPQFNLRSAREYFREHLCAGDYYAQGQKVTGEWFGLGAEKLDLKGTVKETDFLALCEGLHPETGQRLTARKNSHRREDGKVVANRRVFYDCVLSPPKSVSIVSLLKDARILEEHNRAVRVAMQELEKFAEARVRKSGQRGERVTGNLVGAVFRHDTSRELDPHLHTHCVIFNATVDPVENRWKALEVQGMYRAKKFTENLYYHELSKGLRGLGYEVQNNARDFEIKGVPSSLIGRFSKRHQQIDVETQKRVEREGTRGDLNTIRRQVAVKHRRRKAKNSTADRLLPYWESQMSVDETKALSLTKPNASGSGPKPDVAAIVAWADEHLFERKSVARDHELWSAALARGRGMDLDLAAVQAEIDRRGYVREPGTRRITSQEVLGCELAVVLAARQGRNWFAPLNLSHKPDSTLSSEQRTAVGHILGSQDFITLFRGGAGTGKSFTLGEVKRGLECAGHPVVVLAPQRQQVAGLQADGLPADTLARCLEAKSVPPRGVVMVDEAGQIGARQLSRLVALVQAQGGRLILSGDTRQHGAVEASDALLAIERYSGATPALIRQIRRQDPALAKSEAERRFIAGYRAAVKAASAGRIAESFAQLDGLGCIREIDPENRCAELATEYLASVGRGDRALVVAQTWADVNKLNDAIRQEMASKGILGRGIALKTYQAVDLGQAEKRDGRYYEEGRFAYVLQRYGRFVRGDLCPIAGRNERGVVLMKDGRRSTMSYRQAHRLVVAAEREIEVAPGDRLQLKFNGKSADGHAVANGELVTVRRIQADGSLAVQSDNGAVKTLAPGQRLFNRGFAVTSYSSQGKTVDTVLVADSGCQAVADSRHWYVAISRARKRLQVFTSDKEALRANIEHTGERALALDMDLGYFGRRVAVGDDILPPWAERARAILERTRRHEEIMQRSAGHAQRVIPVQAHKIAEKVEGAKITL
jgi:conjugative relaxase-like TrwC/TraI family protein